MPAPKKAPRAPSPATLIKQAFEGGSTKQRVTAMSHLQQYAVSDRETFDQVVATLRDAAQPATLRRAALSTLQTATFDPSAFAPYRTSYMKTLRALRKDEDLDLRREAIGILAGEHDGDTQAMLVDGLENPDNAVLPPEHALQMLSYDPHSGAYDVARRIAAKAPSHQARREALRVLAADPKSATMFEKILRDKDETSQIRQLAACALQHLAPQRLHACARDITVDNKEDDHMRTLGMTVLANFADDVTIEHAKLRAQVASLSKTTGKDASGLKAAALKLAERYV